MKDRGYDNPTRYSGNELKPTPDAELRHFIPLDDQTEGGVKRDRFGNRIFVSHTLGYKDRDYHPTKAALLVSPPGQEFIKNNRGILVYIADRFKALNPTRGSRPNRSLDLDATRSIRRIKRGSQSTIYILRTGDEETIIKTKRLTHSWDYSDDFSQPYINEMLQCQALSTDLGEKLDSCGVEMPTFLFASGQVACRRFERGEKPTPQELTQRIRKLIYLVEDYIFEQQGKDIALWNNISADPRTQDAIPGSVGNFIKRPDGKIVWIDPVFYNTPDHSW